MTPRSRLIIFIVAAVLVVASIAGIAFGLLHRGSTAAVQSYSDSQTKISLQYPGSLKLDAQHQVLSDGTPALTLIFSDNTPSASDTKSTSISIVPVADKQPAESFETTLRNYLDDPNGLLVIHPCKMGATISPCLQVTDQRVWQQQAGSGFINAVIYFDGGRKIYGVEFGQTNTIQLPENGLGILRTLSFGS